MRANGTEESTIYKELYYPFITVSNAGQIAFVSDLTSKTEQEYWTFTDTPLARLYILNVNESEPIEISTQGQTLAMFRPIVYAWSPDGTRLLYIDQDRKLRIFNYETERIDNLPSIEHLFPPDEYPELGDFSWSPDSHQIAATVYLTKGGDEDGGDNYTYIEKNVYIFDLQNNTVHPLIQN
jgi:Tol biopolymer transport system component